MADLVLKDDDAELSVMPSFDFLLEQENIQEAKLAEHRAWLKSIKHEKPQPKEHFKVAVYIRYFNQTKYDDYLNYHKQQFISSISLCPNWEFIGFYVDEGGTAPSMQSAKEWSRLLQDCVDEKVDLIITQKVSNVSRKPSEITFCARFLAALSKPVGIYFVSEDIYTRASYYLEDLKDDSISPSPDWKLLPNDEIDIRGALH